MPRQLKLPAPERLPWARNVSTNVFVSRLYCEHAGLEILHLLDNTFWIQAIATRLPDSPSSADAERVEELRAHVARHLDVLHPEGECTW